MEKHFMAQIWAAVENQKLTAKEKQEKIEQILAEMAVFVEKSIKFEFKTKILKTIEKELEL